MRRDLERELPRLHADARRKAANGLRAHGEAGVEAAALPAERPYAPEQVLREDRCPTNRQGLVDPL